MLEGDLLLQADRERLEAAVKCAGVSWTHVSEIFGLRMDQMSMVRHGKRPWPVRFTEYLEAVGVAIASIPMPAPQGHREVMVGETLSVAQQKEEARRLQNLAVAQQGNMMENAKVLSVASVAAAMADLFMKVDATGDEELAGALDQAVGRLGIEAEVVEAIRERQDAQRACGRTGSGGGVAASREPPAHEHQPEARQALGYPAGQDPVFLPSQPPTRQDAARAAAERERTEVLRSLPEPTAADLAVGGRFSVTRNRFRLGSLAFLLQPISLSLPSLSSRLDGEFRDRPRLGVVVLFQLVHHLRVALEQPQDAQQPSLRLSVPRRLARPAVDAIGVQPEQPRQAERRHTESRDSCRRPLRPRRYQRITPALARRGWPGRRLGLFRSLWLTRHLSVAPPKPSPPTVQHGPGTPLAVHWTGPSADSSSASRVPCSPRNARSASASATSSSRIAPNAPASCRNVARGTSYVSHRWPHSVQRRRRMRPSGWAAIVPLQPPPRTRTDHAPIGRAPSMPPIPFDAANDHQQRAARQQSPHDPPAQRAEEKRTRTTPQRRPGPSHSGRQQEHQRHPTMTAIWRASPSHGASSRSASGSGSGGLQPQYMHSGAQFSTDTTSACRNARSAACR